MTYISMDKQNKDMPFTNISLNVKTVERLKKIGKFGESYDKLINRLIDEHK